MNNNFLKVGKIVSLRGIKGEVKISHFCDKAEVFFGIKNFFLKDNSKIKLLNLKIYKKNILAKIKDINTRTSAEKFLYEFIFADKSEIPIKEGNYFIEDLKNLRILNFKTKKNYGILKDVLKTPTCDAYSIFSDKQEFLMPVLEGTVKEIDLKNKVILVLPIEGIFKDEY